MRHSPDLARHSQTAALALLALLLFLLAAELGARILFPAPQYHRHALAFDPQFGFKGIPDHTATWRSPVDPISPASDGPPHLVRLNREGFRGRTLPDAAGRGSVPRIAFFGDSFLVGEAVPEVSMATNQVESRWAQARPGETVEVFNLGTIDYGTGQALLLLDEIGTTLQPDTIVLALFPANDVINNSLGLAGRSTVSPGDAIRPYVTGGPDGERDIDWAMPGRARVRRLSRLFSVLERDFFPPIFDRSQWPTPRERLKNGDTQREFLEVYAQHDPTHRWERAWRETEDLVRAFRDRCDTIGARLLVVVIPSMHQVRLTPKRIGLEIEADLAGSALHDRVDWNAPESRLGNFLASENIESKILLDSFRQAAHERVRLYSRDRHLSGAGHTLVANAVLEALSGPTEPVIFPVLRPEFEQPVAWHADADPSFLDVREHAHSEHFADGWLAWRPDGENQLGGWQLAQAGMFALRAAEGSFILRGYASGPIDFDLRFLGNAASSIRIERAGLFEVQLPNRPRPRQSSTGHVSVLAVRRAGESTLLVREVGFRPRAAVE